MLAFYSVSNFINLFLTIYDIFLYMYRVTGRKLDKKKKSFFLKMLKQFNACQKFIFKYKICADE